jgi:hypothetical protein
MEAEEMPSDTIRNATDQASDSLNKAAETGGGAMKAAGEYIGKGLDHVGNLGDQISDFARRDPCSR